MSNKLGTFDSQAENLIIRLGDSLTMDVSFEVPFSELYFKLQNAYKSTRKNTFIEEYVFEAFQENI